MMKVLTLPVTGMHCAACAAFIERGLKKIPGITEGQVNYATEKVKISFDPQLVTLEKLSAQVEEWGYGLVLPNPQGPQVSDTAVNREEAELRKRVEVSLPLGLFVFVAMMWDLGHQTWSWPAFFIPMKLLEIISFVIATVVLFWAGRQFLMGMVRFITKGHATMDTLVGLGTFTAYLYSSVLLFFPEIMMKLGLPMHSFFDAAIVVTSFVLFGKYLEARSKEKTGRAVKALLQLQAKTALVIRHGVEKEVPIEELVLGDLVAVKPGTKVPVDGAVVSGASSVDESMITGESIPVYKEKDALVVAGTLNTTGSLMIRAEKLGKDTFLAHIIEMVDQAQGSRAPIQNLADKISGVFVPVVLLISGLTLVSWLIAGFVWGNPGEGLSFGLSCAMAVLVIACPCALGLATPTAVVVGVGRGASKGILVKDAQSLEGLAAVNTLVLDKTGTLTEGKPRVEKIIPLGGRSETEILSWAAALEKGSEHPLASAVLKAAADRGLEVSQAKDFINREGRGVEGIPQDLDRVLSLGSLSFFKEKTGAELEEGINLAKEGMTVAVLFAGQEPWGVLGIKDPLKSNAKSVVKNLKAKGIRLIMITGDQKEAALSIAQEAGVQEVLSQVLPGEKAGKIKELQSQGLKVAMVGDGVNDAPALAQADVGIAMATGTDAAIESAGITLLGGDLSRLPQAFTLSRKTLRVIKQNLFWAFVYNLVGIPLAAGLLYPLFGWLLNPVFAGAAMALSSVSVVTNSLRLRGSRLG